MRKILVIMTLIMGLTFQTQARKYYFSSSTGNDAYSSVQAQNPATPWASLKKMEQMTRVSGTFQPGDTLAFKRGDVFANGYINNFASVQWRNDGGTYWTAPSGTPTNPIVITNYGDPAQPLPNWLWPETTYPVNAWPYTRPARHVICFTGVSNFIIEGIQSNDTRVPVNDKTNPGYTGGWLIGEWSNSKIVNGVYVQGANDPNNRKYMVTNFKVRNCVFSNTQYGFSGISAINSEFCYNTITNLKSSTDTAGVNDVMAGAFEALSGFNLNIHHNYIKGAWAKSGRIGSCNGLGGVGFDIFNLKNSRIAYNTVIDCSGMWEIGNLDRYDSTSGAQYDTFAFNKVINCGNFGYLHGSVGSFIGNNHHLAFWNNVIVSNNKDRQVGLGFGKDLYGDGQGFAPGTAGAWWFCRNPLSTWNQSQQIPTTTTTAGSNIVTVSSSAGIRVGSVAFANNDDLLGTAYQTVTVTSINGNQLTLSVNCTRTGSTTNISYYLSVSDTTWSCPLNSSFANYGGARAFIQYASDNTTWGSYIDTMIDSRNNIMYWTTGIQGVYDRARFKRSNNIYVPLGAARYTTTVGSPLKTGESLITTRVFKDTSLSYPEDWDLRPMDTSYAYRAGSPTPGFDRDFNGIPITTPFIGLYAKTSVVSIDSCRFTYGQWSTCNGSLQTRPYSSSPVGCIGNPPIDSIQRACTNPIVVSYFYYNSSRKAIYIKCNTAGSVTVTTLLGQVMQVTPYSANVGKWISVSALPSGTYLAATYGRSFTFIK